MMAVHEQYSYLLMINVLRIYWIPHLHQLSLFVYFQYSNVPYVLSCVPCNLPPAYPLYPSSLLLFPLGMYQLKGSFFQEAFSDYLHPLRRPELYLPALYSCNTLHL